MKENCSSSWRLGHDSGTQSLHGHQTITDEHHCPCFEVSAADPSYHPPFDFCEEKSMFGQFCDNLGHTAARQRMNQAPSDRQKIPHIHQFHNVFQETSHPKSFPQSQHLGSCQKTQYHTPNAAQSTFKNPGPGKQRRLLLWTTTVHP